MQMIVCSALGDWVAKEMRYGQMDILKLEVERVEAQRRPAALIAINNRTLIEWVREVELPFAEREGHPKAAGRYQSLPAAELFLPSRLLLGKPRPLYDFDGKVPVLGCRCGEIGCWPLLVRIRVDHSTVTWSDFEQPHRRAGSKASHWQYDGLGPFVFDRQQYEAAIVGPETE
jgi:hypothetical protein